MTADSQTSWADHQAENRLRNDLTAAEMRLGGAVYTLSFPTREGTRRAALHLMFCHEHHFAVNGEGQSLVVSGMAVDCLRKGGMITAVTRIVDGRGQ